MKKLIYAVTLAAMVGAGQLAVAAPVQAAGMPQIHHSDKSHFNDKSHFSYKKGKRLPNWSKQKHISSHDYRRYGLRTPPRGYEWVRVGDNFVMVAIATGIIGAIFGAIAANH